MNVNVTSIFWLVLIAFIVALAARRVKVPYALALVITGVAIGVTRILPQAHLEPSLLFTVFLPPLLFEAAINLPIDALQRDWKPIVIYALAGTMGATFLVGGLAAWMLHVPLAIGLVFGALMAGTDPIAIMGVFKRLGAGRRLTLILEAESLFNDAAAVVLFTVLLSVSLGGTASIAGSIGLFLRLVSGGVLVGLLIGGLASRVHFEIDDHLVEITLTTVVAFGAYLSAEALHVSGVIAVVTAGLVIGNYGMQTAMSPGTRLAVMAFWEYAGFVVNSLVFLLIGIEVAYVNWAHKIGLAIGAAAIVLLGRTVIYPLSLIVNRVGGNVPRPWQHLLVWGGLRGALSMALVLGLGSRQSDRETLIAATFGAVLFSLLGQGLTLGPLLKRLGLANAQATDPKNHRRLASEILACEAALAEMEKVRAYEAYPDWSIELLTRDYRMRLALLEEQMTALHPDQRNVRALQATKARRLALTAEKSAYQEAERRGWLEEADWQQIAARIDAELVVLTNQRQIS